MAWTKTILTSMFVIILLSAASVVLLSGKQQFAGWQTFTVKSGSMEPSIHTGSLAFVKQQAHYNKGDVVTFRSIENPNTFITHRIESVSDSTITTKGDANPVADLTPVPKAGVLGKVEWSVPLVGYAIGFLQTPLGAVLFVLIPGTILIYEEIKSLYRNIKDSAHKSKGVATSILVLFLLSSLAVPTTHAAYANYATLNNVTFSTTQWLFPSLVVTQEEQDLFLQLNDVQGPDTIGYSVTYKHVVEGSEVTEQLTGSANKPATDNTATIGPLYIGTCSSEGVCTPHTNISEMKVEVLLKTGSTLNKTLEQDFAWSE